MMKKCLAGLLSIVICVMAFSASFAAGFSQDADAIERTAKSVLKLYVYLRANADYEDYSGTGSGFVAFNSSTLITNYHVIDGASFIII